MNFKKRIGSAILAGVMTVALAVPAFAAGNAVDEDNRLAVSRATEFEIEMTGEVYTPVIRVQVLSKGAKVYINPNKGKITGTATAFGQGDTDVNYTVEEQGVASTPILIRSDSDAALAVNVSATLTAPTGVTFVTTAPGTSDTTKTLMVTMSGTDATTTTAADKVTDIDSFKDLTDNKLIGITKTSAGNGLVDTAGKATATEVCKIVAAKQADNTVVPQYGAVMLRGKCAPKAQWTADDAISATVVLTFSGVTD